MSEFGTFSEVAVVAHDVRSRGWSGSRTSGTTLSFLTWPGH